MFDIATRKERLKRVIEKKSMDSDSLLVMIDFYVLKGKLSEADGQDLIALINPVPTE